MKKIYPLFLLLFCFSCHNPSAPLLEKEFQSLLDQKEYFRLRDKMEQNKINIDGLKDRYFSACLDNVFNLNRGSINKIENLLSDYRDDLSDSMKGRLLLLEEDNYFKTYQYGLAARADNDIIQHYQHAMDSATYADVKNTAIITNALAKESPQETIISGDQTIPWTKNKVGLMEIPVKSGDSSYLAIFDTRANISSISTTYAKKLGVRMLNVSYDEGSGITGQRFKCTLGIADSLRINNILMKHIVFQVMPDEVLYIAPIDLSLPIIIGYPVIAQWREIHIHRNGTMTIPAEPHPSSLHNMALDGLDPVINAIADGDTLGFKFDTGATTSDIFDNYFRRHKEEIMRRGKASTIKLGGAGGVVEKEVYTVENFAIRIGNKTATLKEVSVHKDPIPNLNEKFYGNLGQDIMTQFEEMILNFQDMYVDFK
ncbi:MAG TPA: retropepsin-like aspartic protease [Puia sp.]|nr:retropepsin-like aspartic protease [Puia sp.]